MRIEKDLATLRGYLATITPRDENPDKLRKHPDNDFPDVAGVAWEKLVESIEDIGIRHPVIADIKGMVLSGWQRTRAAAKLGIPVPVIRIPIMQRAVTRHVIITMNLAGRQLSSEQFDKFWGEAYGKRVETMLVKQHLPPGTISRMLSKETGIPKTKIHKRVEAARIQLVKNRSDLSSDTVQRLIKKAKNLLTQMHELRDQYFKVRSKIGEHIKMTDTDLPAIQIREDDSLPIPRVVFEKHHGTSKGRLKVDFTK